MEQIITATQDGDNEAILRDLQQEEKQETGFDLCESSIWNILTKHKFTTKKLLIYNTIQYNTTRNKE